MFARGPAHRGRPSVLALSVLAAVTVVLAAGAVPADAAVGPVFGPAVTVAPPANATHPVAFKLSAVSCTASRQCVAGGTVNGAIPLVERQSGTQWGGQVELKMPPGAAPGGSAFVLGVSCSRAGYCAAVGEYFPPSPARQLPFIATEVHGTWSAAFRPALPANAARASAAQAVLGSVSCTRSGFCQAVGGYRDTAGRLRAMAVAGSAAGRWRAAVELPAPADDVPADTRDALEGISCTGAGDCAAVGQYIGTAKPAGLKLQGLTEVHGVWHAAGIAPPAGQFTTNLTGISCAAAGTCMAVGEEQHLTGQATAVSVRVTNGHFGPVQVITVPAGPASPPDSGLSAVSCVSAGLCAATGFAQTRANGFEAVAMTWAGSRWTAAFVSQPAGANTSTLDGVSCTSRTQCTAVGSYAGGFAAEAASAG